MKCYKLTDADGYTRRGYYNETLWGEGVTHTAKGDGGLCSSGVIHAYESPELALFMNPAHADIENPLIWECDGGNLIEDDGTKQGFKTVTTLHTVELVKPTVNQCIRFAILSAKQVYADADWNEWAARWLDGTDRTADAAKASAFAANASYDAYAYATCAARATYAAYCANNNATYAAYAASRAAYVAYCAYSDKRIDFAAISKQAMEEDD